MIHLIIVDDDLQFRHDLSVVLERLGDGMMVGESNNPAEVIALIQSYQPDIVLPNDDLAGGDALEITGLLRSYGATVGIIIFTQIPDEERLFQFLKVGANAYTRRTVSSEEFLEIIRRVSAGGFLFSFEQS